MTLKGSLSCPFRMAARILLVDESTAGIPDIL